MRNELLQHWGNWGTHVFTVVGKRKKDVADTGPRWFRWVLTFPQKSIALRTFNDVRAPINLRNHGACVSLGEGEHWSCPL